MSQSFELWQLGQSVVLAFVDGRQVGYPHHIFAITSRYRKHIRQQIYTPLLQFITIIFPLLIQQFRNQMTSIRNSLNNQKTTVEQRIIQLTQKMNSVQFTKTNNLEKRYEDIDAMCDGLQNQLQLFKSFMDEKFIDIKHKTAKITKQLKKDPSVMDNMLKQQITNANQRMLSLIQQQNQTQRETNFRIAQFIQEQSNGIKEMIQKQAIQKEQEGRSISESLNADIAQIRMVLDQVSEECKSSIENVQTQLYSRTNKISQNLRQICSTYISNQQQFYKMLRDLVKKVKSQLYEHKNKRQQTETQILNLIDQMCDKKIEKIR